jgi:hypothetical protein
MGGDQARRRRHHRDGAATRQSSLIFPASLFRRHATDTWRAPRQPRTVAAWRSRLSSSGPTPAPASWAGPTRSSRPTPTGRSAASTAPHPGLVHLPPPPRPGRPRHPVRAPARRHHRRLRRPRLHRLRDLFPMEEALALSDTLTEAAATSGAPHVSGPGRIPLPGAVSSTAPATPGLTLTAPAGRRPGAQPRHAHLRQPRTDPRLLLRPRQGPVPSRHPRSQRHGHPGPDRLRQPVRQHRPHRHPHRHPAR